MPTESDCNNHVIHRVDLALPDGAKVHIKWFDIFDPAIMIDCTRVSDDTNVYLSEVLVDKTFVRVTRHKNSGNDSYFVSLNGGNNETKHGILTRFQEHLHIPVANFHNLSIQGSYTYEWVVQRV